jgi:trimethylamine:corrinoid methyltransferase-like protein
MLDWLACHSAEKLVLDAELIASARRLVRGIETPTPTLALDAFVAVGKEGFLALPETRALFRTEQHLPSAVIDRDVYLEGAVTDAFARAHDAIPHLVASWKQPELSQAVLEGFGDVMDSRRLITIR